MKDINSITYFQGSEELRALDDIADLVLAYRPKIKTKAAKRRARRNKRASKSKDKPKSRE